MGHRHGLDCSERQRRTEARPALAARYGHRSNLPWQVNDLPNDELWPGPSPAGARSGQRPVAHIVDCAMGGPATSQGGGLTCPV